MFRTNIKFLPEILPFQMKSLDVLNVYLLLLLMPGADKALMLLWLCDGDGGDDAHDVFANDDDAGGDNDDDTDDGAFLIFSLPAFSHQWAS